MEVPNTGRDRLFDGWNAGCLVDRGSARARTALRLQQPDELLGGETGLADDRSERSLLEVAGVVGDENDARGITRPHEIVMAPPHVIHIKTGPFQGADRLTRCDGRQAERSPAVRARGGAGTNRPAGLSGTARHSDRALSSRYPQPTASC